MELANTNDAMRWCCKRKEFRNMMEQRTVQGPTGPCISTTTRCVVCFNNHYLMEVPPVELNINGGAL